MQDSNETFILNVKRKYATIKPDIIAS